MTLFEIRKLFCETSGRWDLRNDDGSDNGANYFINTAISYLDSLTVFTKAHGMVKTKLTVGNTLVLPLARSVDVIFCRGANGRWEEIRRQLEPVGFLESHNDQTVPAELPEFYFIEQQRGNVFSKNSPAPLQGGNVEDVLNTQIQSCWTVVFHPELLRLPLDVAIFGLFKHPPMTDDIDENFWTINHPNIVVYAACREIEILYRNTQGVKDWEYAIMTALIPLEQDAVLDEANHVTRILY